MTTQPSATQATEPALSFVMKQPNVHTVDSGRNNFHEELRSAEDALPQASAAEGCTLKPAVNCNRMQDGMDAEDPSIASENKSHSLRTQHGEQDAAHSNPVSSSGTQTQEQAQDATDDRAKASSKSRGWKSVGNTSGFKRKPAEEANNVLGREFIQPADSQTCTVVQIDLPPMNPANDCPVSTNTNQALTAPVSILKGSTPEFAHRMSSSNTAADEGNDVTIEDVVLSDLQVVEPVVTSADNVRRAHNGNMSASSALLNENNTSASETAPQSPMMMTSDVSFRSSFLHQSGISGNSVEAEKSPVAQPLGASESPASEHSVRHIEVALHDANFGSISVRTEMKDGMLHAFVTGRQADAFVTASALHGFLEGNQVAVHSVRVESAPTHGAQKVVSISTLSTGSFDNQRNGRNPNDEANRLPSGQSMTVGSKSDDNRNRFPAATAQVLTPILQPHGQRVSIHI